MSKTRLEKNFADVKDVLVKFRGRNEHLLSVAIIQLIEREKVRVLNNYLKAHNEPLISTDPPRYPGGQEFEWIIPVPQEWYSLTGKEAP